jgi:signal transduction histidine kinase
MKLAEPTTHYAVLYVDDEPKARLYFLQSFEDDFPAYTAANANEAMAILEARPNEIGVLISDQRMPGENGVGLLERARKLNPNLVRILITAYSDYQTVVDAVNSGRVFRYMHKPWNPEELLGVLHHAIDYYSALIERENLLNLKSETIRQMHMADKVGSMGILAEGLNHHLRNSLTAIRAFIDLSPSSKEGLENAHLTGESGLWLEFRKHAQCQLDRIYSLLNHVSEASPNRTAAPEEPVNVAEIITKVYSVFDHAYSAKHVAVYLDLDPTTPEIPVHAERFQQLWRLLFTEELTHLSAGDELIIAVSPAQDHSGRNVVRISIRDTGDWPAEEHYENLFDPFFVRTNKPEDFGVNMMACYSIVHLHGGTIHARSGSLNGVEITMDFPCDRTEPPSVSDFFQSLVAHERRWKDRELEIQSA